MYKYEKHIKIWIKQKKVVYLEKMRDLITEN